MLARHDHAPSAGHRDLAPVDDRTMDELLAAARPVGVSRGTGLPTADGTAPTDIEVHSGEREDKILRHAASNYWRHPTVINGIRTRTTSPDT